MKYEKPKERVRADKNLPDEVDLPAGVLCAITWDDSHKNTPKELIENLNGNKKRDWFVDHAYFCLPLTMGNQHGFIVKASHDFSVYWNGGDDPKDVIVKSWGDPKDVRLNISSHFGMGTVTVETPWMIRTPKGVNLLVMNPPNFFNDGIIHMTACVETDNLRRNFTFNLKITRPHQWFLIKKNDPVGYMLPYPRYFIDNYTLKVNDDILDPRIIKTERDTSLLFGVERNEIDSKYAGGNGYRYINGEDIYGNKFKEHQKGLNGCPFGFGKNNFGPARN